MTVVEEDSLLGQEYSLLFPKQYIGKNTHSTTNNMGEIESSLVELGYLFFGPRNGPNSRE